jgi:predicted small secreted protein
MMGKVGRLTITVLLILAIALTLDACNLPTGIGEEVFQRTTEHTEHEHTTTTRSTSSSGSSSGTCPAGVICSSSSSSSESSISTSESSSTSLTFRTLSSTSTGLTFRTLTSSSTPRPEPGCAYWGFLPGTISNVTITISGTRTNQTNSTVVQTTCVIPGFPIEGTIIGAAVGLLFVIMNRKRSRRVVTN